MIDSVPACPAPSQVTVPVRVSNFVDEEVLSLKMSYLSSCLTYQHCTSTLNWPVFICAPISNPNPGYLSLGVAAFGPVLFTLPDNAVLFTVTFSYHGGSTDLIWDTIGLGGNPNSCNGYVGPGQTGILSQPASQQVMSGDTALFSVQVINAILMQYQWQESADGGISWTNLTDTLPFSGTATASLSIAGVVSQLDQHRYRCTVTGCDTSVSQDATLSVYIPPSLLASLHYQNAGYSPLQNATIVLFDNWIPVYTVYSGLSGDFGIPNIQPGTYTLAIYCQEAWGGANALDGLMILQHFTGMINLGGLAAKAADVNADGAVNSLDALMVLQRFVGSISTFSSGDWQFSTEILTIPVSGPVTLSIEALCTGDVNGSHLP